MDAIEKYNKRQRLIAAVVCAVPFMALVGAINILCLVGEAIEAMLTTTGS